MTKNWLGHFEDLREVFEVKKKKKKSPLGTVSKREPES